MKALSANVVAKANNVFATFGTVAASHAVSTEHAAIDAVRAALPRDARAHYSALSPVGKVAALFQDEATARDIFIADGNAFEASQGRFFLSSVALFLHMGDEAARGIVRDAWADSKDKRREYALKIFRLCAKAIEAGKLADLRNVSGFASLQALQPKKDAPEKAAVESTPAGNVGLTGAPDAEQTARAEQVAQATSRAADIAATLDRMSIIANALSDAAVNAASLDSDTLAAWAGELNVLRASVASVVGVDLPAPVTQTGDAE
jgi:hypothetical protein